MAKKTRYTKELAKSICKLIREDSYTVAELCAKVGCSERSYYLWRDKFAEFAEGIKRAEEEFKADKLVECRRSLNKLISGYSYEEKELVVVNNDVKKGKSVPVIKEQKTKVKHVAPNLGAIIHFQTNMDPANWKNRQSNELTGKDGKDLLKGMTDEELDAKIKELEDKVNL